MMIKKGIQLIETLRLGLTKEEGRAERLLDFFCYGKRTVLLVADTQSLWALYEEEKDVREMHAPFTSAFIAGLPLQDGERQSLAFIEAVREADLYSLNVLDENLDDRANFPLKLPEQLGDLVFLRRVEGPASSDVILGFSVGLIHSRPTWWSSSRNRRCWRCSQESIPTSTSKPSSSKACVASSETVSSTPMATLSLLSRTPRSYGDTRSTRLVREGASSRGCRGCGSGGILHVKGYSL